MALYSLYLVIDMKQLRSKVLLLSFSGNLVYLFIFYIFYILETYRTPCFKMMKIVKETII